MGNRGQLLVIGLLTLAIFLVKLSSSSQIVRRFSYNIERKNVRRLCHMKRLLTVNGKYPGPTIFVHEGDNVEVKVTNRSPWNTTIHWHGVRQLRSGWADGPAYITQCPIVPGGNYTYKFTIINQRGTLWWHAHLSWQRATVYGAFIIYPRTRPYPFSASVEAEIPIIFGEWWNGEIEDIENDMKLYGSGPNSSDAYTINGLPGPSYPCSNKDTFIQTIEIGKTYLLRIINAALNDELFFAVANHTLTVVEIDAVYTKPFTTKAIMITPGQTTNVLITANQIPDSTGTFVMAARPYLTSVFPFDNSTTIGFLKYKIPNTKITKNPVKSFTLPSNLPQMEDTQFATKFTEKLKSLGSPEYPCNVPKKIDKRVITTISLNLQDCPVNQTCKGFKNKKFYASMNNQSFVRPSVSILESHYRNLSTTMLSSFPERPPHPFNYTGVDPLSENLNTEFSTRILVVPYGTRLEIVFQDTSFLNQENHPIHVHGHNFFIVGRGFGNYDVDRDTKNYNVVDPPERNTVGVPVGGWAAIRVIADNPGVWFIHCHLEEHTSWGLAMGLIVQSGQHPSQCLLPPPHDFPTC
ncbi:laccase-1 [Solanum tuberosum]|uniref:Laccase n=2 Tax=Solanum tuberosum TaxID=4113 RepID=M1DND5_SOLTU|nr:PREDICTED: laccase-1 [Solanum tuberosum]